MYERTLFLSLNESKKFFFINQHIIAAMCISESNSQKFQVRQMQKPWIYIQRNTQETIPIRLLVSKRFNFRTNLTN